ncbi:MAG: class I SAM-dependent methyltransferase [Alphaproteobacteria bacterium]|nr:class I SAM-dependent methyltransferase [Alphaproteobacteria bacterium]
MMSSSKWDQKYEAAPGGLFGNSPNEYVREIAARSDFAARTGLCLADGDGRNSRWLAARGLQMTAVDLSAVACANGERLDAAAGVRVERIAGDVEDWQPAEGRRWEAVFVMYLQAPEATRMAAVQRGWIALDAGGWIVVEAFAKAQAAAGNGLGPGSLDLMYDLEEFCAWLPDAEVVEALAGRIGLDEGGRHHGLAHVVRFAARKY